VSEQCSEGGELHFNKAWNEGDEDGHVTDAEVASVDNPLSPRYRAPPKSEPINYVIVKNLTLNVVNEIQNDRAGLIGVRAIFLRLKNKSERVCP